MNRRIADRVVAVAQHRRRDHRDRRRVAVGRLAAGSRRLSRITTPLTVTSTPLVKRGRNTDQARAASPAGRTNCAGEARRIVHRMPQRGEIRQRHRRARRRASERLNAATQILGRRLAEAMLKRQDAGSRRSAPAAAGIDQAGRSAAAAVRGRAVVPPSRPRRGRSQLYQRLAGPPRTPPRRRV